MTAQVLFDTARFRDRLTSSGMPDAQARAVTEGFEDALRDATATKADVERLGDRLDVEIVATRSDLERLGARLDAKIESVEHLISARIDTLDESVGRRIAEALSTQSRWIIACMFGGIGFLFAALKLVP